MQRKDLPYKNTEIKIQIFLIKIDAYGMVLELRLQLLQFYDYFMRKNLNLQHMRVISHFIQKNKFYGILCVVVLTRITVFITYATYEWKGKQTKGICFLPYKFSRSNKRDVEV